MFDLRLLQVDHADYDGNNFGHLPQGLKWLSLKGISSKCVLKISHLEKLAVLDLSESDITDDWNGWQQIQLIRTLKVLDLSHCNFLKSTPHFSCDTSLERLILDECMDLVTFHESIGHLQKLVFLSLNWCIRLPKLPNSICKLSSIKSLILSHGLRLKKLPKELGNMESLTELIIDFSRIEEIPDSIGLLVKLERLSARECSSLVKLPHSMGNMKSLTELIIDQTRIEEIPDSIGLLEKLERLSASGCNSMVKLPHSMGTMKSLTELIIDGTAIEELPEAIGSLEKLEILSVHHCIKLMELPDSICKLSSIKSLILSDCWNLKKLPNLSNLKSLQELCLSNCKRLFEIQGISGLSLLQQIDLEYCRSLQVLPELPPGLIKLNTSGCTSMKRLPNLSTLKNLKELRLDFCFELAKIEGIDGLTLLQELDLKHCSQLQALSELPSSLTKLNVCYCEKLFEIQGISGLSLLQTLHLDYCTDLQSLPKLPSNLITLDLARCSSMEKLPDLSNLKILEHLRLEFCDSLAEIQGLESLESLIDLRVHQCHTYIKNVQKSVSQGMLPTTAFNRGEICKSYLKIPDDDNIKGMIFYFVYSHSAIWFDDIQFLNIEVEIQRNDGKKMIKCFHDLRILSLNTDKDQFYSCYFQGLTWFGCPLKKRDMIHVKSLGFQSSRVELKMLDLVMEYEAMEDSPQLEKRVVRLIISTSVEREGARECGGDDDDAGPSSSRSLGS